ncbi:5,10-methylene tetrahydromethanopterin reductase, partial [Streptomyces hydrogenans]
PRHDEALRAAAAGVPGARGAGVGAGAAVQRVGSVPAGQGAGAGLAAEDVVAVPAADGVVAGAAVLARTVRATDDLAGSVS